MNTGHFLTAAAAGLCLSFLGCAPVQEQATDLSRWENPPPPPEVTSPSARPFAMPVEATIQSKRRHRAEFMNSSQVAAALRAGRDVAILPVGGLKGAGPDMPLGTSLMVNHATALMLAQRWDAIVFPPVPFGWAGEARSLPGTVSTPLADQLAYIREVAQSLLNGGFKRVVLLGDEATRDDMYALACSIYRDTRVIVMPTLTSLWPRDPNSLPEEFRGPSAAWPLRVLAAMRILGHPNLAGEYRFAEVQAQPLAAEALAELRGNGLGAARWTRPAATQPAQGEPAGRPAAPVAFTETDVDRAVDLMRAEARKYDAFPALFAEYQAETRAQDLSAPWSLENYTASAAACRGDGPRPYTPPKFPPVAEPPATTVTVRMDLPEEAQPAALRRHRAEFITAREMAARMKDDPVVILPCGAFEMHGPHGLLGTDAIEAYSQALVVARQWDAIVLPPVYYTYAGATERWPGTVSVSPEGIVRYVQAVATSLLESGLKRVVILWVHAPGRWAESAVVRGIQQAGEGVIFSARLGMWRGERIRQALGYGGGEDIATLAGVKIMGHPGVFAVDEPADVGIIKLPFHGMVELNSLGGRSAWNMGLPTHHLAVRKCVRSGDEDRMIPVMREAAAAAADAPKAMSRYLRELDKARKPAAREP